LAIDGLTAADGACAESSNVINPWMRVDMERMARIDAVKLYTSTHGLQNFEIRVSNFEYYKDGGTGSPTGIACASGLTAAGDTSLNVVCPTNTYGRYIYIAVAGSDETTLRVCEVQVQGDSPLNKWQWRIRGQPSFSATFSDSNDETLLKIDALCDVGQVCGFKSAVTISFNNVSDGGSGSAVTRELDNVEKPDICTSALNCEMELSVIANDDGFHISWYNRDEDFASSDYTEHLTLAHRFPASGVRNFKMATATVVSPTPYHPTVITTEIVAGEGSSCVPAALSSALPAGSAVYGGGGSMVDGNFVLSAGGYTKSTFTSSLTGDYTYASSVQFGSGFTTAAYSFWATCGINSIVFSNPPKLTGCEFGDVALGAFAAAYGSAFSFSAGRRNGKLSVLVNGQVLVREHAMTWAVTAMGWGHSDASMTIFGMSLACSDPSMFTAPVPATSCTEGLDYVCNGNLSSAMSVVDGRATPQGGARICGGAFRIGGHTSWAASSSYGGMSDPYTSDVGVKAIFGSAIASGGDFAFESVVLFEEGLTPYSPWGVAFQFFESGATNAPYYGQEMFGFEYNYSWTQGGVMGASSASADADRYQSYVSAPNISLSANTWHTFTFLRQSGMLTVLVDGSWVLTQTVSYDSTASIVGIGWRSGRTTMRVREMRQISVSDVNVPVMPSPPPQPPSTTNPPSTTPTAALSTRAAATVELLPAISGDGFYVFWYYSADGSGGNAETPPGTRIADGNFENSNVQTLYAGEGGGTQVISGQAVDTKKNSPVFQCLQTGIDVKVLLKLSTKKYVSSFSVTFGMGQDGAGGRKFCHQSIKMSNSSAFAGEEVMLDNCGASDCPVQTEATKTIEVNHIAQYFLFSSSESDVERYVELTDFDIQVHE